MGSHESRSPADETKVAGIITRSDLLEAHKRRLDEASRVHTSLAIPKIFRLRRRPVLPPPSSRH